MNPSLGNSFLIGHHEIVLIHFSLVLGHTVFFPDLLMDVGLSLTIDHQFRENQASPKVLNREDPIVQHKEEIV